MLILILSVIHIPETTDQSQSPASYNTEYLGGVSKSGQSHLTLISNHFQPTRSPSQKSGILQIRAPRIPLLLFFHRLLNRALSPKPHVIRFRGPPRVRVLTFPTSLTSKSPPFTLPLSFQSKSKDAHRLRSERLALRPASLSGRSTAHTEGSRRGIIRLTSDLQLDIIFLQIQRILFLLLLLFLFHTLLIRP